MHTNKRTRNMRPIPYRKLGKAEYDMLDEVRPSDLLVGMLFSACSIRAMNRIARNRVKKRRKRADALERTLAALARKGLLQILEEGDNRLVRITDTGKELLQISGRYDFRKPKAWDGAWRIVMFDIPNDHKELRHELRRVLEHIGFLQLQQSVYVFPYSVMFLEAMLRNRKFPPSQVSYCTTRTFAYDELLRKHFKLHEKI